MRVIGCCYDHSVDVLLPFEHLSKISVHSRPRVRREHLCGVLRIHITQRTDIFIGACQEIIFAHAADSYSSNIEFLAARLLPRTAQHMPWSERNAGRNQSAGLQEIASIPFHRKTPLSVVRPRLGM